MEVMLLVHIIAGGLGLVSGFVALFVAKGAGLHRNSGLVFVYSMVTMAVFGAVMGAINGQPINVIAGTLTTYLVITALNTLRPPTSGSRRLDVAAMLVALALGVASLMVGFTTAASASGARGGGPAGMFIVPGIAALWASVSDLRMIWAGGLQGRTRLTRHLWRMCWALFIAAGSFFLGQADEFPAQFRIYPLLAMPALAPLLTMVYWLWRLRSRPIYRGSLRVRPQDAA